MNTILDKVKIYLDKVSSNPVAISEDLVEEFGEACKSALRRQFSEKRRDSFEPRMSNIGRPLCQLQMESKGIKGDGQPYNNKMRNISLLSLTVAVVSACAPHLIEIQLDGGVSVCLTVDEVLAMVGYITTEDHVNEDEPSNVPPAISEAESEETPFIPESESEEVVDFADLVDMNDLPEPEPEEEFEVFPVFPEDPEPEVEDV